MKFLSTKLVNALINSRMIAENKKDDYIYGIEFLIMKFLGICMMIIIGFITRKYIETLVFYFTFSSLRKYTNGYHTKSYISCVILSSFSYLIISMVLSGIVLKYIYQFHILTFVSIILIYILSPVNSDNIQLNQKELKENKEIIKYILLSYLIILFAFVNFKIQLEFVAFFELAILCDLLLVVIGKYYYKNGGYYEIY